MRRGGEEDDEDEEERRGSRRRRKAEEAVVLLYESRNDGERTVWVRKYTTECHEMNVIVHGSHVK